jgi:membrane protein implicated in regulation of membrane protease activity
MREAAGLSIVVAVLAIAPALIFSSMIWWVVAVAFVVLGLLLFYSGHRVNRERDPHATSKDKFDGGPGPLDPGRGRRIDTNSGGADAEFDGD